MSKPKNWREGQFIFNFLEWLAVAKNYPVNQSSRMADPFHISDEGWNALLDEWIKSIE